MSKEFNGVYREKKIFPVSISAGVDLVKQPDGSIKKVEYVTLHGKKGEKIKITNPRVWRKVMRYLWRYTGYKVKDLRMLPKPQLSNLLTKACGEYNRPLKVLRRPDTREIVGVTSGQHKQFSWDTIKEIVQKAVHEVYGDSQEHQFAPNHWAYLRVHVGYVGGIAAAFVHAGRTFPVRANRIRALFY